LANPGFVLEPDLERPIEDIPRRERGAKHRGEVL
jgi:hypothetical protein